MIVRQNPGLNERVNRCQFHLVDSGQLEADSSWHFNHICSPFNRLYFIRAGEAFVADASGKTRLLPGRIYLIPAGRNSHYCCPVSMQKVYFHFNLFLPNGFDLFEGLDACLEIPAEPGEIDRVYQLSDDQSLAGALALRQHLDAALSRLIAAGQLEELAAGHNSELVQKLFALVYQKVTAKTRVQDLARQLSVSGSTLSKSFRQETGRTVSEYLDSLLLRQACRMLLSTNLRIGEIAEKLQFCDPYYFSRYFKSRQQETPSHYRRRMSGSV